MHLRDLAADPARFCRARREHRVGRIPSKGRRNVHLGIVIVVGLWIAIFLKVVAIVLVREFVAGWQQVCPGAQMEVLA